MQLPSQCVLKDSASYALHHRTSKVLCEEDSRYPDWNGARFVLQYQLNCK